MIRVAIAAALSVVAVEASAINRYQTMSMTCNKVKNILNREGAAILRYPSKRDPSLTLYGRFVKSRQFCLHNEVTDFASVPTSDTDSCPVRKCVEIEFDFFR